MRDSFGATPIGRGLTSAAGAAQLSAWTLGGRLVSFPQYGTCLCSEIEYRLDRSPITVYACHCTECQRQTGASFALYVVSRRSDLTIARGEPSDKRIELSDGRHKDLITCSQCGARLWGPSSSSELVVLHAETLNDISWPQPVAHIWTRSAQSRVELRKDSLTFAGQPQGHDWIAIVQAWQNRR